MTLCSSCQKSEERIAKIKEIIKRDGYAIITRLPETLKTDRGSGFENFINTRIKPDPIFKIIDVEAPVMYRGEKVKSKTRMTKAIAFADGYNPEENERIVYIESAAGPNNTVGDLEDWKREQREQAQTHLNEITKEINEKRKEMANLEFYIKKLEE